MRPVHLFFDGLPLTLIGSLAIVVIAVWLVCGVGPRALRLAVGLFWMSLLVGTWAALLYAPSEAATSVLLWFTLSLTAASFAVPFVWKRAYGGKSTSESRRHQRTP